MLGPLCAAVKGTFLSTDMESSTGGTTERLDRFAQSPRSALLFSWPRFQRIRLRQSAQGQGRAEGSKKEQEKAPALFRAGAVTPPRSAGRFRAERLALFLGLGSENNACPFKRA